LAQATEQNRAAKAMERALKEGKKFDEQLTQLAQEEVTPSLLEDDDAGSGSGSGSGRGRSARADRDKRTSA